MRGPKRGINVVSLCPCAVCTRTYRFDPVNEYLAETEAEMTKAETGQFMFDDLRELAASHAQQKLEFEKLIPESISLGLFVVRSWHLLVSKMGLIGVRL